MFLTRVRIIGTGHGNQFLLESARRDEMNASMRTRTHGERYLPASAVVPHLYPGRIAIVVDVLVDNSTDRVDSIGYG